MFWKVATDNEKRIPTDGVLKRLGTKTIKSWKLAENIENDGNDGNTAENGSNPLPEPVSNSDLNNHSDNDGNKTVTPKTLIIEEFQPTCYPVTDVSQTIEKIIEEETKSQKEVEEKVKEKFAKNFSNDGNTETEVPKPLIDKTSIVTDVLPTNIGNVKQNNGNIPKNRPEY